MANLYVHTAGADELEPLARSLAELEAAEAAIDSALAELASNLAELAELTAGALTAGALPLAPVVDALEESGALELERWPEGWHAADTLHEFDCTPADIVDDYHEGGSNDDA